MRAHPSWIAGACVAAAAFVLTAVAPASAKGEAWLQRYDGPPHLNDGTNQVVVSPDGNVVFVTGGTERASGREAYLTLAIDAHTGDRLWARRYAASASTDMSGAAIAVAPSGDAVFVTGTAGSGTGSDLATVAYDAASGDRLWARRYGGPAGRREQSPVIAVGGDGSSVFVGATSAATDGGRYVVTAYDPDHGSTRWTTHYDGIVGGENRLYAIASGSAGKRVFVTGASQGRDGHPDYATLAYRASDGARCWVRRFRGKGTSDDVATGLAYNAATDRLYVTGHSDRTKHNPDYRTFAYDARTGAPIWMARYDGPAHHADLPTSIAVSADGSRVFVLGFSVGQAGDDDYATVAYDAASGVRSWVRRYDGPFGGNDFSSALAVTPDGRTVFVTGSSPSSAPDDSVDYATVEYDASTGVRGWVHRYDGTVSKTDLAIGLATAPDGGDVFVTGFSCSVASWPPLYDSVTIAYAR